MADQERVTALLDQIAQQGQAWKDGTLGAREALISSAIQLRPALSTPTENVLYATWASSAHAAWLHTAAEMNLFEALAAGGATPQSSAEIAGKTEPKADPALVGRVLRHLAAMGTVREVQADGFVSTSFSLAMCREAFKDTIWFGHVYLGEAEIQTGAFMKQIGYANPDSDLHTPWHLAYKAPAEPIWAYWAKNTPEVGKRFANMMHIYSEGRPWWFQDGYYPIRERLIQGADTDRDSVFLVDIGSGAGHDSTRMLQAWGSEIPGKVVIQDRPEVMEIAEKTAAPELIKMPHDFFAEEPVKGARAYYLHSIIHNWSDEKSEQILRAIVTAMKPGYSKILICDCVIEDKDANWLLTGMDYVVMAGLSARERTRKEFQTLAEKCGLKLTNIFSHPQGIDSIVELELA